MSGSNDPKKGAGDSGKGKGKATGDESTSEAFDQAQLVKLLRDMQTGGQVCRHVSWLSTSKLCRRTSSGRLNLYKTLVSVHRHRQHSLTESDESKKAIPAEEEGPIANVDPDKVKQTPPPLPAGYEWSTVDLTNEGEVGVPLREISIDLSGRGAIRTPVESLCGRF
jgi:hypothetical protein